MIWIVFFWRISKNFILTPIKEFELIFQRTSLFGIIYDIENFDYESTT